jgi:hypothetical protein
LEEALASCTFFSLKEPEQEEARIVRRMMVFRVIGK